MFPKIKLIVIFSLLIFNVIYASETGLGRMQTAALVNSQKEFAGLHEHLITKSIPVMESICKLYFPGMKVPVTRVVYFSDNKEWQKTLMNYAVASWSDGFAIPERKIIYLRIGNKSLGELQEILLHEWLHVLLRVKFPYCKIPLWFEEGTVQLLSGEKITLNNIRIISLKIASRRMLNLEDIDSLPHFYGDKAKEAYILSLMAVTMLPVLTPEGTLQKMLAGNVCVEGDDFSLIFEEITGISPKAFESRFLTFVQKKYKWFFIFNFESLLFIFMLVIMGGAYYGLKYRNKKILAEWQKKEIEEAE